MSRVNTKDRIMQAALKLFMAQGYQKTSIARIETDAGLVPRAGAFYRHFAFPPCGQFLNTRSARL